MVKILTKEQEKDRSHFVDAETNTDLEVVEQKSLLEWLAEEYTKFGCTLEFVTNKSQEGSQFCRGFGGIGGEGPVCALILRATVRTETAVYDSRPHCRVCE